MKNHWLRKTANKGHYWTYEVFDNKQTSMVPETVVNIDECPSMKVVEKLEVEENGRKVWKPVLVIWEKFEATYTDEKFLEGHNQIRLLEANGEAVGILRLYIDSEHVESWVMHGLELLDIDENKNSIKAVFTFHHAVHLAEELWENQNLN